MTDQSAATETDKEPDPNANAGKHAAEQAKEYGSPFDPHILRFDDGDSIEVPPNPLLRCMDDDQLAAYDAVLFETESYDRGPEIFIPEQRITDTAGNEIVLPSDTRPGPLLTPYRKTDENGVAHLITPPHEVRVVQAVLGDEVYNLLRSKKINKRQARAADVIRLWNEQSLEVGERQRNDSKSDGGTGDLAPVAPSDSE